jgi:hypothetical protein
MYINTEATCTEALYLFHCIFEAKTTFLYFLFFCTGYSVGALFPGENPASLSQLEERICLFYLLTVTFGRTGNNPLQFS